MDCSTLATRPKASPAAQNPTISRSSGVVAANDVHGVGGRCHVVESLVDALEPLGGCGHLIDYVPAVWVRLLKPDTTTIATITAITQAQNSAGLQV